jgi:hypothetical protein
MNQLIIKPLEELKSSLTALQPASETARLITYTLVGVALTGIMVYSYIKQQEGMTC